VDSKEAKNVPAKLKKPIRAETIISASKGESASRGYCLSGVKKEPSSKVTNTAS